MIRTQPEVKGEGVGRVLVREECRGRPKLGRERKKRVGEGWMSGGGGILGGMWPASDHVCWVD